MLRIGSIFGFLGRAAIKRLSCGKRKQKLTAMHRSLKAWMNPDIDRHEA